MSVVTHTYVDPIPDNAEAQARGEVLPSHWNAVHTVSPTVADAHEVLISKNVDADNVLNGDFTVTGHAFDINPISGRWNQTYSLGYNLSDNGTPLLAGEPTFGLHWESFFESGGNEYCEFHTVFQSDGGDSYRAESYSFDRATDVINHQSLYDVWTWGNKTGNIFCTQTISGSSVIVDWVGAATVIRAGLNNHQLYKQMNAAGNAFLPLPWIDTDNRIRAEGPGVFVGPTPAAGSYDHRFFVVAPSTATAGDKAITAFLPNVTGSYTGMEISGSITADMEMLYYNSSGGPARVVQRLLVAGAGDPLTKYELNGGQVWVTGIDNSDLDRFKLSSGNDLGTNDAIAVNSALNVTFGKEIEFTEMTAPSAPAANGCRLYVQDNGGGKTQLMALFSSGAAQQVAIQP